MDKVAMALLAWRGTCRPSGRWGLPGLPGGRTLQLSTSAAEELIVLNLLRRGQGGGSSVGQGPSLSHFLNFASAGSGGANILGL